MCDISIIVPAYNSEKTLPKCLESILAQSKKEFEVILVDDGSSDGTAVLCDAYSERDKRIRVFHNSNHGTGYTRQYGLDRAVGEYVIGVDSDDWIEPEMMKTLYDEAVSGDFDMVICDIVENRGNFSDVLVQKPLANDWKAVLSGILLNELHGSSCNKLIKRKCIINNGIKYPDGLNMGEDILFNAMVLKKGISVSYVPGALYHYEFFINPASVSKDDVSRRGLEQREMLAEQLRIHLNSPEFESFHNYRSVGHALFTIKQNLYSKEEYLDKYERLANLRWKEYPKYSAFSYRLIVWSSFHISYDFARFLLFFKQLYRKIAKLNT